MYYMCLSWSSYRNGKEKLIWNIKKKDMLVWIVIAVLWVNLFIWICVEIVSAFKYALFNEILVCKKKILSQLIFEIWLKKQRKPFHTVAVV